MASNSDLLSLKIFDKTAQQRRERSKLLSPLMMGYGDLGIDPWKVGANYSVTMNPGQPQTMPAAKKAVEITNDQVVADVDSGFYMDPTVPAAKRKRPDSVAQVAQAKKGRFDMPLSKATMNIYREANMPIGNARDQFVPGVAANRPIAWGKPVGGVVIGGTNPTFAQQASGQQLQHTPINFRDQENAVAAQAVLANRLAFQQQQENLLRATVEMQNVREPTPAERIVLRDQQAAQPGQLAAGNAFGPATPSGVGTTMDVQMQGALRLEAVRMRLEAMRNAAGDMNNSLDTARNPIARNLRSIEEFQRAEESYVNPEQLLPNPDTANAYLEAVIRRGTESEENSMRSSWSGQSNYGIGSASLSDIMSLSAISSGSATPRSPLEVESLQSFWERSQSGQSGSPAGSVSGMLAMRDQFDRTASTGYASAPSAVSLGGSVFSLADSPSLDAPRVALMRRLNVEDGTPSTVARSAPATVDTGMASSGGRLIWNRRDTDSSSGTAIGRKSPGKRSRALDFGDDD